MYCKNCGRIVDDNSSYCSNCGTRLDSISTANESEDSSSFGFAILGFFIPIVGLILFLIYEGKKPKRAKSAGKGALIGFITKIVLIIILVILYSVSFVWLYGNMSDDTELDMPTISDTFREDTIDEILEKYVDVSFGGFEVSNNGYYSETSLDITVKNKAKKQYSYYITIEAVDSNGARIATDTVLADRLGSGQEIYLTAFKYVDQDKIEQFKNASFRVLEISMYDF